MGVRSDERMTMSDGDLVRTALRPFGNVAVMTDGCMGDLGLSYS